MNPISIRLFDLRKKKEISFNSKTITEVAEILLREGNDSFRAEHQNSVVLASKLAVLCDTSPSCETGWEETFIVVIDEKIPCAWLNDLPVDVPVIGEISSLNRKRGKKWLDTALLWRNVK